MSRVLRYLVLVITGEVFGVLFGDEGSGVGGEGCEGGFWEEEDCMT